LLLTRLQVDVVGKDEVGGCLCVRSCQIELAEVGHVEHHCVASAAQTLGFDLRSQFNVTLSR